MRSDISTSIASSPKWRRIVEWHRFRRIGRLHTHLAPFPITIAKEESVGAIVLDRPSVGLALCDGLANCSLKICANREVLVPNNIPAHIVCHEPVRNPAFVGWSVPRAPGSHVVTVATLLAESPSSRSHCNKLYSFAEIRLSYRPRLVPISHRARVSKENPPDGTGPAERNH
jgi:hypothetical protein